MKIQIKTVLKSFYQISFFVSQKTQKILERRLTLSVYPSGLLCLNFFENIFRFTRLHWFVYISCSHILEILNSDSRSQFSKSQSLSRTMYLLDFWKFCGSISNNTESTSSTSTSIVPTHIPNLFLHKATYRIVSGSDFFGCSRSHQLFLRI